MSERLKLIQLEIGVTDSGVYCTTYLTPEGDVLKDADSEFKELLDAVVAAVAKALSGNDVIKDGAARTWGPGAEVLAKTMGDAGVDVEVVDGPTV